MSSNTPEPAISAEPTFNYMVQYSFAFPKSDLRPENQRWGQGSIPINTDKPIISDEEKMEVARYIGVEYGYERVAITKIESTDYFVEDRGEVLEGLIVND